MDTENADDDSPISRPSTPKPLGLNTEDIGSIADLKWRRNTRRLTPEKEQAILEGWSEMHRPVLDPGLENKTQDHVACLLLQVADMLGKRQELGKAEKILKFIVAEFRGSNEASRARVRLKNLRTHD